MNAQHSSTSNEHYTPPPVVEAARDLMGTIHLDPFSTEYVNTYLVKAETFYSEDGYNLPYKGNLLVNPPGGCVTQTKNGKWINSKRGASSLAVSFDLLEQAYLAGDVEQAIFIGFSLELISRRSKVLKYPICFINSLGCLCYPQWIKPGGRLCYADAGETEGEFIPQKSPTHGSFIIYLPKSEIIKEEMELLTRDNLDKKVIARKIITSVQRSNWDKQSIMKFKSKFSLFGTVGVFNQL